VEIKYVPFVRTISYIGEIRLLRARYRAQDKREGKGRHLHDRYYMSTGAVAVNLFRPTERRHRLLVCLPAGVLLRTRFCGKGTDVIRPSQSGGWLHRQLAAPREVEGRGVSIPDCHSSFAETAHGQPSRLCYPDHRGGGHDFAIEHDLHPLERLLRVGL